MIQEALHSGRGADKFRKMIHAQGGDQRAADDPSLLPLSDNVIPIKAEQAGYIYSIDARGVGQAAHILGAGRSTKEDPIDHSVGIVLSKRMGEMVRKGETLAYFYVTREDLFERAADAFKRAVVIKQERPQPKPLVYGVVTAEGIERY